MNPNKQQQLTAYIVASTQNNPTNDQRFPRISKIVASSPEEACSIAAERTTSKILAVQAVDTMPRVRKAYVIDHES